MNARADERAAAAKHVGVSMTDDVAAWTARDIGLMPGLGNERPRGGAEIKADLEPGLAVLRYLYDNSRVDAQWSVLGERGYTWWADGLAQRAWSEPALDDDGIAVSRVFVETDLVEGVSDVATATRVVDDMNGVATGSALVVDPEAGTVRSVASMWVHEQTLEVVARSLSVIGAIQVAVAQDQATLLSPAIGGELALSSHPASGVRPEPDEMLGLIALVRMNGQPPSLWAGEQMEFALEQMQRLPAVVLATGDAQGVTIEVPFEQATALIQLDATWTHPQLGAGMMARLSLPRRGSGPEWATGQNRLELASLTRAHFVGAWIGSAPFPVFHSFYPNMLARTGTSAVNIALSMIGRARWVAQEGRAAAR
jgi:hypothetical protein